jgi:ABC-type lipoprotein export system ATPase subunit
MVLIEKKYVFFISAIIALQFIASSSVLLMSGKMIDAISTQNNIIYSIIYYAIISVFLQIFAVILDIFHNYIRRSIIAEHFYKNWVNNFPKNIFRNFTINSQYFYEINTKIFPQIIDLKMQITAKITLVLSIYILIMYKSIDNNFFWGFLFIPIISIIGSFSSSYKSNEFKNSIQKENLSQINISKWIHSYFKGFREINFNWNLWKNNTLPEQIAQNHKSILLENNKIIFLRSLYNFLMVDFPYIICHLATILAAFYGKITIGDAIVWWGLSHYLVNASLSLRDIKTHNISKNALTEIFFDIQKKFNTPHLSQSTDAQEKEILLLDQTKISLKTDPGIVIIDAKNGSGKSTFLDTITGLNNNFFNWTYEIIIQQRNFFQNFIKIIDKNPVVFENIKTIDQQILGPIDCNKGWLEKAKENTSVFLSPDLAHWWNIKFETFHKIVSIRWSNSSTQEISSGESVILSIARVWCSWDCDVKLIIIDESLAPLDQETKVKLLEMLKELSAQCTIYLVTHEQQVKELLYEKI